MLTTIRDFFGQWIEPGLNDQRGGSEHALQVATAALLLEMMRMDGNVSSAETVTVVAALRSRFGLAEAELTTLLALADAEASEASGYYQFTSLINKGCSAEQKVRIIEAMWQVAFADGHLDAHEQHLLRKIADLLHVSHADYIAAKQRGREAAGYAATRL